MGRAMGWEASSSWERLCRGEDCPLCALLASRVELDEHGLSVRRSQTSLVRLARDGTRGSCTVVATRHVVEPFELPAAEAAAFFDDVQAVARSVWTLWQPVKINYRISGNHVPHLHCDVLPRYRDEDEPQSRTPGDESAFLDLGAELRRSLEGSREAAPLRYEPLGMDDLPSLQGLCESCADYYHLMTGEPVHPSEASALFSMRPETAAQQDKFLIAVWRGARMVGALDVYRHYPAPKRAWIGLLLLHPEFRGYGHGAEMISWVLAWARQQGCERVRVAVAEDNQRALDVLSRLGFLSTGERILRVSGARRLVLEPLECRL
jgi:RimJ/RimL family protein N-acetyltransferase/diadenosine tetraphosphate (Ap4A) HIT family hydrolase